MQDLQGQGMPHIIPMNQKETLCAIAKGKAGFGRGRTESAEKRPAYFGLDKAKDFGEFKRKYFTCLKNNFKRVRKSGKIDLTELKANTKTLQGALSADDYDEYIDILSKSPDVANLYAHHFGNLQSIKRVKNGGAYKPSSKSIEFDFDSAEKGKFSTLAHECGHYFDDVVRFTVDFGEIEKIQSKSPLFAHFIEKKASSSDDFLEGVRADKKHLKKILTADAKAELYADDASAGVQDAIDGLFDTRIRWGHGNKYYNRKYDKIKSMGLEKMMKEAYQELGYDASSQVKVKAICRTYGAASEMWANIVEAVTNGGKSLEYVKKYLPNSYKAFLKILKGVKK